MDSEPTGALTAFLAPTPLCDCGSVTVRNKANQLTGDGGEATQSALSIFRFVRDGIAFALHYADARASDTLEHGTGFCMTKTNLQMALLRAAGIPSRCHLARIPKDSNQPLMPKFFYDRLPETIVHPWCECHLYGRWVACDSVLDVEYYRGLLERGYVTAADLPSIDWDGRNSLIIGEREIAQDLGTFPSWDEGLKAAKNSGGVPPTSRIVGPIMFALANRRIRAIRAYGRR